MAPRSDHRDDVLDEETTLLASASNGGSGPRRKREPTPLPRLQISILMLFQLAEPMTSHCIYPFINQLVSELDITKGDPAKVGYYAGLLQSIFFATEALTVLHWSRLSDRIGRKPVLLIGLSGLFFSMIAFGLSRTFWTLVVSRALAGLLNGNIGVIKSMVGELTDSTNMAQAFGVMPVVWATGVTIAPLIGGTLYRPYRHFPNVFGGTFWHKYPYFLPCFVSACFSGFSFFIALVFLKETVQKPAQQLPYKQSKLGVLEETTTGQYGTMGTNQAPGDLLSSQQPTYRDSTSPSRRQANISGDTLVEPQDNGVVPFRQLLTGPVLLSIANYGMLAILDISLGALQPLFFSTPIEFGGLGFSPARIGLVLGLFGILNGIFQGIFFARIVNWWGLRRTFMISMLSFVFIFALFPVISTLARKYGVGTEVWIAIVVQLLFWVIMDMAYGSIFMYITSASPSKRSLGSVNGAAQLTASIVRTLGPAASTSLFAVSIKYNILGGCLVYLIMGLIAVSAVMLASQLPGEAHVMEEDDAQ